MRNMPGDVGPECVSRSAIRPHQHAAFLSSYGLASGARTLCSEAHRGRARLDRATPDPPCRQDREATHLAGRRETCRREAVTAPEVRWGSRTSVCAVTAGAPRVAAWLTARLRRPTPHPTRGHQRDVSPTVGQGTGSLHPVRHPQDREGNHAHEAASLLRRPPCARWRTFLVYTHPKAQDHHAVHHARSNNRLHLTIGMAGEAER
jgi:hypothetical protein